jgi:putative transposase
MAQTFFRAYFHIVFSTKNRFDLIPHDLEPELYAYIGGILRNLGARLIAAGGTANHIHLLISVNKEHVIPTLVGAIKRESSKWIKTKGGGMLAKFGWQDGYSAFTVGHTQLAAVKRYLANQKEHHQIKIFEEEMRDFYGKYEIEYDERYVWD